MIRAILSQLQLLVAKPVHYLLHIFSQFDGDIWVTFEIIILFQCELRKCSIECVHSCGQMDEKINSNVNHMLAKTYIAEGECLLKVLGTYSGGRQLNRDGIPFERFVCDDSKSDFITETT